MKTLCRWFYLQKSSIIDAGLGLNSFMTEVPNI